MSASGRACSSTNRISARAFSRTASRDQANRVRAATYAGSSARGTAPRRRPILISVDGFIGAPPAGAAGWPTTDGYGAGSSPRSGAAGPRQRGALRAPDGDVAGPGGARAEPGPDDGGVTGQQVHPAP